MFVFKNFKNTPRSPPYKATGPKCIFFSNSQGGPWAKKNVGGRVAPPTGDRGLSPTQGVTGACRPWGGRQGPSPPYKPWPPFAAIPIVI